MQLYFYFQLVRKEDEQMFSKLKKSDTKVKPQPLDCFLEKRKCYSFVSPFLSLVQFKNVALLQLVKTSCISLFIGLFIFIFCLVFLVGFQKSPFLQV